MKAALLVESLTGNTWKAAERIAADLEQERWTITGLTKLQQPDYAAIQDADIVLVGTWVHGLFVVGQTPWALAPISNLPAMRGKQAAVFCTFALNPGKSLDKLTGAVEATGATVVGGLALSRSKLDEHSEVFASRLDRRAVTPRRRLRSVRLRRVSGRASARSGRARQGQRDTAEGASSSDRGDRYSTTTLVPTPAQFHIHWASAVDWRTQPPDSGWPSWRLGLQRDAVAVRDLVEPDAAAAGAVGEADHVAPLDGRVGGRVRVHRAGVDAVRAGVRLAGATRDGWVLTTVPSASTAQTRCCERGRRRPAGPCRSWPAARRRRSASGAGAGAGAAGGGRGRRAPDAEPAAGRRRRRCRRRGCPDRAATP